MNSRRSDHGMVLVFAKTPEPGRVKTRLQPELGEVGAAQLAEAFLLDTWAQTRRVFGPRVVLVSSGPALGFELSGRPDIWSQGDGDLGQRMERAMARALDHAPWALCLGTDSPGLPAAFLERAADRLSSGSDAVLGPTADGGYYALGLGSCPPGLLRGLPWSSEHTGQATRSRLQSLGYGVRSVDPWWDVDEPADLERLISELEQGLDAPATRRCLEAMGLIGAARATATATDLGPAAP